MSANLITGNLFSPITAAQDSDFQAGILGDSTYIMPVGNQMALTIVDANTISAADGVIVTKEGRRIQIDTGGTETFTIPTGTVGTTAYYIIGFHLYTDANTSAELCETFVEAVENSTDRITENTFKGGYTEIYVSLGLVTQDGINLDSVTSLLSVGSTLKQLNSNLGNVEFRINNGNAEFSIDGGSTWNQLGGSMVFDMTTKQSVTTTAITTTKISKLFFVYDTSESFDVTVDGTSLRFTNGTSSGTLLEQIDIVIPAGSVVVCNGTSNTRNNAYLVEVAD